MVKFLIALYRMSNMTDKQQVTAYARGSELKVCGKGGVPMLSNKSATWVDCFDSWADAKAFIVKARNDHFDRGIAYPWAKA